jgi:nucleotide-binding universal stress UspA family protein
MISRVLLGYDGSLAAIDACNFAVDLARRYRAELHILSVARPPEFGTEVETEELIEQGERHCARLLKPLQARLGEGDPKTTFEIVVGHPAEQILLCAERRHADHIVVGRRGHTLFARWLLGSVARQVIAHAACAVTVVRAKDPHA